MYSDERLKEIIVDRKVCFEGRIFSVEHLKVRLNNNQIADREIVRHRGGAAVLAVTRDGLIPFVSQYRVAVERPLLEIPAGKIEIDEDPALCACRELQEECGFVAKSWSLLSACLPSPGYLNEKLYIYLAENLEEVGSCPDPDEFLNVEFHSLKEALSLIQNGVIDDAKTIIAIQTYALMKAGTYAK